MNKTWFRVTLVKGRKFKVVEACGETPELAGINAEEAYCRGPRGQKLGWKVTKIVVIED